MTTSSHSSFPDALPDCLRSDGIALEAATCEQLLKFAALVRHWNAYASLMSDRDIHLIESLHIPDALSLAGTLLAAIRQGRQWIDLGSGGGFPALPVRILAGELPLTLVERSEKKSGVLQQQLTSLHLDGVSLRVGSFPQVIPHPEGPVVVTARAIEKPVVVHQALAQWMRPHDVFLCQAAAPEPVFQSPMFHVEHITDCWTETGLRRGSLYRIERLA
ncbi:MAG: hypothetical protein RLZZ303_569 [Candidatus Hydrogenedentota bacterium]|jgi:16S rRNA (guanine527-N7)-methyltransferase